MNDSPTTLNIPARAPSPYIMRMQLTWQAMRDTVIEHFLQAPGLADDKDAYLQTVEEVYAEDAYHSLSIEGYRVSPDLIERVRGGAWNPDQIESDIVQRDALAARGYHEAFQTVKHTVAGVLDEKKFPVRLSMMITAPGTANFSRQACGQAS